MGLTIQNLTLRYGKTVAVASVSFEVNSETVVLFGPSGCGKTSVLKAILGVSDPGMIVQGSILLDGNPITKGDGSIGMVFQGPVIPMWMTVFDLCRMGCKLRTLPANEQRERILAMLKRFEIDELADRYPYQLSGGQKQRAALAVTLLNDPRVLLLDEPTTFIDGMTRISIWEFVEKRIRPLGIPVIIVSHDPFEALTLADKIYVLSNPARVIEELSIPFGHPRSEEISREQLFWDLRERLCKTEYYASRQPPSS